MEAVVKRDHGRPAGRCARDLDRVLNCFRAAVEKQRLLGELTWRKGGDAARQFDVRLVHRHAEARVRESSDLPLDGLHHFRVRVTHRQRSDAGGEV